jgi:hypothetical protein
VPSLHNVVVEPLAWPWAQKQRGGYSGPTWVVAAMMGVVVSPFEGAVLGVVVCVVGSGLSLRPAPRHLEQLGGPALSLDLASP